jgi:RHS repeat-associated protein
LGTQGSYGPDRIVKTTYDAASEVTKVTTAYGVTGVEADEVTKTYTNNGQVQTLTDGEGNKTTYVYDGLDRLSQTQYPSATKGGGTSNSSDYEQLGYDANGSVTSRRLRDGNSIAFGYDALNRVTVKDLPGSEPDISYAYDLLGRLTSAATSSQTYSFTYDALGRNLTQVGPNGTLTSAWDTAGRRTRLTHPDGFYVDQDYLVTGELQHIRENGAGSGVGVLATYAYDDLGRRTSLTRGNGTTSSYTFDNASRLTQIADDLSGTSYDQTLGFSYNAASQIASNTRSNDNYAWTSHYNVNRSYTSNGLNQYTASGSITPTYDTKGNLTSAGSTTYGYSSENLLTSATGGIALAYDPLTRLYQTSGGTLGTTRFQYDGTDLVAEYNGSNSLLRRYVHGPGSDEPVVWYEGSGTTDRRFLTTDERGSVVAVTNSSGTVTAVNSYDEYGIPASGNSGRFGYTGQTWLPELGLWYYKARIYSPTLGRFMQTDPMGYGDGMNIYAYVTGDPVGGTDPTGLLGEACPGTLIPAACGDAAEAKRRLDKATQESKSDEMHIDGDIPAQKSEKSAVVKWAEYWQDVFKLLPDDKELLSGVVKTGDAYSLTVPHIVGIETTFRKENLGFRVTLRASGFSAGSITAFVHNHSNTLGFSSFDLGFARSGYNFYYFEQQTGALRMMTPQAAKTADPEDAGVNGCPNGVRRCVIRR